MINVDYAIVVLFIESMNFYVETALNLPGNKEYAVKSVVKDLPQVSLASRERTLFITVKGCLRDTFNTETLRFF
jgi:hypothetical protein